jgi:hypothetical protein
VVVSFISGGGDGENFQSGTADEFDVRYHQTDF